MGMARLTFVALLATAALASAAPADNPWPSFRDPAPGPARAIGDYSSGCLQGAAELPLDGVGYQVMRPSRRRYFGHPALIEYVQALGERVHDRRLGALLVGDLSQPRGGRAASGHASHQTGLDVDLWYSQPKRARVAPLSISVRESLSAESVLEPKGDAMRDAAKERVEQVLRLAVEDARVDRLFVHPLIKRTLCEQAPAERDWLRKVRPWHGHDDHFHVRLACPPGSADCRPQAPLPAGDGCDALAWWFRPNAEQERKQARKDYQKVVIEGRGWPEQCEALLQQGAAVAPAVPASVR